MSMPSGHRIRLRGPWEFVWLDADGEPTGEPVTIRHPDDWLQTVGKQSGTVRLTRVFHSPTNLSEHEAVFVVLTEVRGRGDVRLNGQPIGRFAEDQTSVEFRLPLPLANTNALAITVSFPAPTAESPRFGLCGTVALEIRKHGSSSDKLLAD